MLLSSMEMGAAATHIIAAIATLAVVLIGWWCGPRIRWPPPLFRLFRSWRFRLTWIAVTPLCIGHLSLSSLLSLSARILPRRRDAAGNFNGDGINLRLEGLVEEEGSLFSSEGEEEVVGMTAEDLQMLFAYIDEKDGGPPWKLMMDRFTSTLACRAWRRDPKFGPTQYRSRTIIENVGPELLKDFFWDDEFRTKWDDMIVHFRTLRQYPHSGTMIVHWIRKFPFFCGDREYIIIRRIWEFESTYYCISKGCDHGYFSRGMPFPANPSHQKPRRVDLYYSSWRIRAVESRNGGDFTASEVLLFHYEEMGIPKLLAKVGIQRGMWGLVKRLDLGVRAYQMARLNGAPPPRYAHLAHISTEVPVSTNLLLEKEPHCPEDQLKNIGACGLGRERNMLKWLIVGGVIVICGLKRGELSKGPVFYIVRGLKKFCSKGSQEISF